MEESCNKQFSFSCNCHICTNGAREAQKKEEFKGIHLAQKDQAQFNNFTRELSSDGKMKKPEIQVSTQKQHKYFLQKIHKKAEFVFEERNFNWLMENLLSKNDQILGCEINIPETVLFE